MKNNNNNKNIDQIWEEIFQMEIKIPNQPLKKLQIKITEIELPKPGKKWTDYEFETLIDWKQIRLDLMKM